ncbi:hypothetical protein DWU95_16730, partial [Burkholderia contaminans]
GGGGWGGAGRGWGGDGWPVRGGLVARGVGRFCRPYTFWVNLGYGGGRARWMARRVAVQAG